MLLSDSTTAIATASRRMSPSKAFWSGAKFGVFGSVASIPFVAYEASNAQRGEVVPTVLGRTVGMAAFPALSGALAAGGATTAAALGLSVPFIGAFAVLASIYPEIMIGNIARQGVREITGLGQQVRHLEFGGHYTDTETAQRLRMQSVYEMSGANSAARHYLGQEAYFLHK